MIRKICYLLPILAIFASCTAPIDIETDNSEPVIVIVGNLTDELKLQEIRITSSSPYFQNDANAPISGATVTIESTDNKHYELFEVDTVPGLYRSSSTWAVSPGITYNLHVLVDFDKDGTKENYDASTTVASKISLDSIKIVPMDIMGHKNYSLNLYGQEPPEHNYYLFKYIVNDSLITTKLSKYVTSDDIAYNDQYLKGLTLDYFDDISEWATDSEEQRKRSKYIKPGDKLVLQMSSVPQGYHDFINQAQKEMNGENPIFGGPASNITTNITGGVGYFSGYCISTNTTTVE